MALTGQKIPIVSYIIINIFFILLLFVEPFSLLIGLVLGNIFGVAVALSTKWIRIEYQEKGELKTVYFAEGSWMGWGGMLGETRKLILSLDEKTQ